MSPSTTAAEKPESMMTRVYIDADDWTEVRRLALKLGITTPQLIGDTLRERLEQEASK